MILKEDYNLSNDFTKLLVYDIVNLNIISDLKIAQHTFSFYCDKNGLLFGSDEKGINVWNINNFHTLKHLNTIKTTKIPNYTDIISYSNNELVYWSPETCGEFVKIYEDSDYFEIFTF